MDTTRFETMGLSPELLRAVQHKGFDHTTPVQQLSIPPLMEWRDLIAKAPTGTGKTLAFGIPLIEHTDGASEEVQGLVLAPTRELALQITNELQDMAMFKEGVRVVCVYGGQPIERQIQQLKKRPQIVVATPGRLLDLIQRRLLRLDKVKTAVLDEADRMLDMGFLKEVRRILDMTTSRKNLALLSATLSQDVLTVGWLYQRDPEEITVPEDVDNKPDIDQFSINLPENERADVLQYLIERDGCERCLVFCNTKHRVHRLTRVLTARGLSAGCIHGDITQSAREKVLDAFRGGRLTVMVATDVAARGIDVEGVDTVFNFDVPNENEYYTHRIGRTGRAKRKGISYTFVSTLDDVKRMADIVKYTRSEIKPMLLGEDYKPKPPLPSEHRSIPRGPKREVSPPRGPEQGKDGRTRSRRPRRRRPSGKDGANPAQNQKSEAQQ